MIGQKESNLNRVNPERYGETLHRFLQRHKDFFESRGLLLPEKPLGEGKDGVVYYDISSLFFDSKYRENFSRVIKFTISDDEIYIARWLSQMLHPNLPRIYWTWGEDLEDIEDYPILFHGDPIYVFCREILNNCVISADAISLFQHLASILNAQLKLETAHQQFTKVLNKKIKHIAEHEKERIMDFSLFLWWAYRQGLLISDIHQKNLSQREDKTLVLRDFGHCVFIGP